MNNSGQGAKPVLGRPPKWGKRVAWNLLIPVELARAADIFRKRDKASQSELVTRALVELLKGAAEKGNRDGLENNAGKAN